MNTNKNKNIAYMLAGLFILAGSYNAIVINSDSNLTHSAPSYSKRLDEVYGVVTQGRSLATTTSWKKLNISKSAKVKEAIKKDIVMPEMDAAPTFVMADEAVLQSELSLKLVEVVHPVKWKDGLANSEFSGSIETNNGVIESLNIVLPQSGSISINYAAMTGNIFEYDLNGDIYSAMIYQVDQNSFMVTLSNGPLEGARLRFSGQQIADQAISQNLIQENHTLGQFGSIAPTKNNVVQNQLESENGTTLATNGFAL